MPEAGYLRPPGLPQQERYQDWGTLRAPVREMERPPSLFERMTASFARHRPERPEDDQEPVMAEAGSSDRRVRSAEEETLEIPAFLRR
jgi:hypothetical protein